MQTFLRAGQWLSLELTVAASIYAIVNSTAITYVGNSSGSGYTILIGYTITVTGNSSFTIGNNYTSLADGSPTKSSALYE